MSRDSVRGCAAMPAETTSATITATTSGTRRCVIELSGESQTYPPYLRAAANRVARLFPNRCGVVPDRRERSLLLVRGRSTANFRDVLLAHAVGLEPLG